MGQSTEGDPQHLEVEAKLRGPAKRTIYKLTYHRCRSLPLTIWLNPLEPYNLALGDEEGSIKISLGESANRSTLYTWGGVDPAIAITRRDPSPNTSCLR
jgi:hypothetical protein